MYHVLSRMCLTENVVSKEKIEGCFAHVINTIDNNEVAKGLRYCGLLCNAAWESLRQVLTTYRMSCLIIRIVLCMDNADFEKLCGYIDNHEQNKHLSELYYGKQICSVDVYYMHVHVCMYVCAYVCI